MDSQKVSFLPVQIGDLFMVNATWALTICQERYWQFVTKKSSALPCATVCFEVSTQSPPAGFSRGLAKTAQRVWTGTDCRCRQQTKMKYGVYKVTWIFHISHPHVKWLKNNMATGGSRLSLNALRDNMCWRLRSWSVILQRSIYIYKVTSQKGMRVILNDLDHVYLIIQIAVPLL